MKILSGLFDQMVMCRNNGNVSEQPFSGKCSAAGDVTVKVLKTGKPMKGVSGTVCGKAGHGTFSGVLKGIPAGGPYEITLTVGKESITVGDVLVGDVWVSGGQSNMQGYGNLSGAFANPPPSLRVYYMTDRWGTAREPVTLPAIAKAPVHYKLCGLKKPNPPKSRTPFAKGTGPAVSFLNEMYLATGVPQGMISCAHGGTTMEQWDPKKKNEGDESLYGAMLNRVRRNGGRVSGMIWYQGCSDAQAERVQVFEQAMKDFVKAVRRDFDFPGMPFVQVQIARLVNYPNGAPELWTAIREIQRTLPSQVRNLLTVPTIDLELDDGIHLAGEAQQILGKRLANAMRCLLGDEKQLPPIELGSVSSRTDKDLSERQVLIRFKNVSGNLKADGRPSGFSVDRLGKEGAFRTEVKGDGVLLHCPNAPVFSVGYGCGCNPYCNIHDESGRSLPAFAMKELQRMEFRTPFATYPQISEPFFCEENLKNIHYKDTLVPKYAVQEQDSPYVFLPDRLAYPGKTGFRFIRVSYEVPETMDLAALFGYDGPAKLFIDGKEVFADPNGKNPILLENHKINVRWKKGVHEIVFALAMRDGNAWGVSLCLKRPGIKPTKRNLAKTLMPTEKA